MVGRGLTGWAEWLYFIKALVDMQSKFVLENRYAVSKNTPHVVSYNLVKP